MEEYDTLEVIKILEAASELSLQELISRLQSFLIENRTNWVEQNFSLMYQTSFKHGDSLSELQKFCIDLVSDEPEMIFNSHDFTSIPEKLLVPLIQNDNLQASEVQVWEHVLKWGLAQNSELPSDPTRLSKTDFNVLKNSLQQCIPFIRFYNLTSEEFSDKVLPYRKILPKDLYMDLLKYFLNPNSVSIKEPKLRVAKKTKKIKIDSKIITSQHAELISERINESETTDKSTSQYEFKLLFRGSRDGLTCAEFHKLCDNQSRTVTIVKISSAGYSGIIGRYNPVTFTWSFNGKEPTAVNRGNFVFAFDDDVENCDSMSKYEDDTMINYDEFDMAWPFNVPICRMRIRYTKTDAYAEEVEVFQIV